MKRRWIVLALLICGCLNGCGKESVNVSTQVVESAEDGSLTVSTEESEDTDVEFDNSGIVAEALGIAEDDRKLKFILRGIDAANVGKVTEAQMGQEDGSNVLDLVSEDGVKYRVYLSGSLSVEGLKNLDTEEWLIKTEQ